MSPTAPESTHTVSGPAADITVDAALAELIVIAGDPEISPTMRLIDADIDSLDIIEWLERLETVLGVDIADAEVFDEISPMITIGQLIDQMLAHSSNAASRT